jgi:hypothetical protein
MDPPAFLFKDYTSLWSLLRFILDLTSFCQLYGVAYGICLWIPFFSIWEYLWRNFEIFYTAEDWTGTNLWTSEKETENVIVLKEDWLGT